MIILSGSRGDVLLRMSILAQLPKVIFLSKLRYKCRFAVDPCVYTHTFRSEITIILLPQRGVFSGFANPLRQGEPYPVVKEVRLQWYPQEHDHHVVPN